MGRTGHRTDVRVLLDTHVFVWGQSDAARLDAAAWRVLRDPNATLFLSVASAWELGIKHGLGKIALPVGVEAFVADGCRAARIELLPVALSHVAEVGRLPHHHRDPFDRMLIAQARREGLELLTRDPVFARYEVALAD